MKLKIKKWGGLSGQFLKLKCNSKVKRYPAEEFKK